MRSCEARAGNGARQISDRGYLPIGQTRAIAQTFFIWASVFNLFVVSLFWSLMAELWRSAQAKRLYGFSAAGRSCGALLGPYLAQAFVQRIGADSLLILSAAFLGLALALAMRLRAMRLGVAEKPASAPDSGILAGALLVWRSPYLMRIALWVLLANLILTYFYLEQARIVGAAIANREERVALLSRIDLAVSVATILMQVLLTAGVLKRFGLGLATAIVPIIAIGGFIALAIAPVMSVILTVMVLERAFGFAFANPAARVLWTVVDEEAKYKAQNFIDKVVFRGGDAASGWVFGGLTRTFGLGGPGIALVTVPFAIAWVVLSLSLSRMHQEKADKRARPSAAGARDA
jgi:AAA family ATP:ADP antiporter